MKKSAFVNLMIQKIIDEPAAAEKVSDTEAAEEDFAEEAVSAEEHNCDLV